jgi:hypothetical protein
VRCRVEVVPADLPVRLGDGEVLAFARRER